MTSVVIIGLLGGGIVSAAAVFYRVRRHRSLRNKLTVIENSEKPTQSEPALNQRLEKTRLSISGHLSQFFGRSSAESLNSDDWSQIEEALLAADVGYMTTQALITEVKGRMTEKKNTDLKKLLRDATDLIFSTSKSGQFSFDSGVKPLVISVVGINGAGKTTTVGKLAQQFKDAGKIVLLGAVDTFRAGAISQLKVWADRTGSQFVTGREGADPGAVAFDSVSAGKARGVDVVLLDTAGRLHTKSNLMEELKKIHRVIKKVIPEAPHETWLVIDGTLGQNSLVQAKEFKKALDLTGVIVTKLDGTAKGGAILAIASELNLPVRYIGLGEAVQDLAPFNSNAFIDAILG